MTTSTPTRSRRRTLPRISSERAGTLALTIGTIGFVLVAWELAPRIGVVDRTVIPTASDTWLGLQQLLQSDYWWEDFRVTMYAVLIAWLLGCGSGLAMGVLMGASPFVRAAVTPYTIAVQALPKIVLAPLIIGWLGFGSPSKIAIAVAICFFPVWIDTMVGLSLPSSDEFTLMRSMRATRWQIFRKLQLPSAVPLIMVGIKHAMLLAFTGVLVAEILAASAGGMGTLVEEFSLQLNMRLALAVIAVVIVVAVTLVSIMDFIEQRVVFWSESARQRKS